MLERLGARPHAVPFAWVGHQRPLLYQDISGAIKSVHPLAAIGREDIPGTICQSLTEQGFDSRRHARARLGRTGRAVLAKDRKHHVSVSLDTDLLGADVEQVVQGVRVEGAAQGARSVVGCVGPSRKMHM